MSSTKVLFLIFFVVNVSVSYRILVVCPSPSYSHQIIQQAVSEGLANAGHQVTIIAPFKFKTEQDNISQIVTESVIQIWKSHDFSKGMTDKEFLNLITAVVPVIMDEIFLHKSTQKLLDSKEKYDAVIVENLGYIASHAFAEHFNATLIGLTSMEMFPELHSAMGNPGHPMLHRSYIFKTSTEGFFNRINALFNYLRHSWWFYMEYVPSSDWVLKKHFKDLKLSSRDLLNRIDLAIEGQSPVLGNTRPLLPNTVQISFLHVKPVQKLPDDLQQFLDNSVHGVIYVSFGSNVKSSSLSNDILNTLIATFAAMKYNILWKFETNELQNKPKNVKIGQWLPQQDLLAHKNIKLFITQGGIQSLEETIARGVPVVVIPFFSDQEANADKVIDLQIGQMLNIGDLTIDSLTKKVDTVIDDPSYRQNIQKLGDLVRDTPMSPVETAVWYIEYAIRNRGAKHLKYKGTEISFIEFWLIDVICLFVVLIVSVAYFVITSCGKYCKILRKSKIKVN